VRLATSALLADAGASLGHHGVADALLAGYRRGLESGGPAPDAPQIPDDSGFWARIDALPDGPDPPPDVLRALLGDLPAAATLRRVSNRIAGLGSRDHPRFVARAQAGDERVVREAKLLAPTAVVWQGEADDPIGSVAATLDRTALRDGDPTLHFAAGAVIRRLAPDCGRVELADVPKRHDRRGLLVAMGHEVAALHRGSIGAEDLAAALEAMPAGWLADDSERMRHHMEHDWRRWKDGA
jgi:hypothetical protein